MEQQEGTKVMNKTVREHIIDLLIEIEREDTYAQLAIKDALQNVDIKDKALMTEVIYGTLKHQIKLDYILNQFSKTPVRKMKPFIRTALRMSVYQLLYLDKIPTSAVINEAVKITKKRKFQNLSGFVNGVLREIDRQRANIRYPNQKKHPILAMSIKYSIPEWMIEEWLKVYPKEEVEAICMALNERAKVCGHYNPLKASKEVVIEHLREEGLEIEEGKFLKDSFYIKHLDKLQDLASFKNGEWTVQDESATLVGYVLAPQKGERVLDMCSAPGGKSIHMAQLMENQGEIRSCDVYAHKLELIQKNAERMGISIIKPTLQDGTIHQAAFEAAFDKVLLDAPCSGLGIMKRKPDIRHHRSKEDIESLVALQQSLATQAISYVKPGGKLVYSTCTISYQENEEMVAFITSKGLELESIVDTIPKVLHGAIKQEGMIQILPSMADTDGFFIASFRKRSI